MKGDRRVLTITVPKPEQWDSKNQEFIMPDGDVLELEHSLVALSKWESKYKVPFLGKQEKTTEQIYGYVKAMTVTPDVSEEVFSRLTEENFKEIDRYINDAMSATWFSDSDMPKNSTEVITNELIYYWLSEFNIPLECQEWHLNRLFTFIRVKNIKSQKPKKMSPQENLEYRKKLNEQRRAEHATRG